MSPVNRKQQIEELWKRLYKSNYGLVLLIALVFVLFGTIGNFVSNDYVAAGGFNMKSIGTVVSNVFISVGASVAAADITTFIFRFSKRDDLESNLQEKIDEGFEKARNLWQKNTELLEEIVRVDDLKFSSGLIDIIPSGEAKIDGKTIDYSDEFDQCRQIDLCCLTAGELLRLNPDALLSAVKNGCKVRLLFANLEYGFIKEKKIADGYCPETNVKEAIVTSLRRVNSQVIQPIKRMSEKPDGQIEVGLATCVITSSSLILTKKKEEDDYCVYTPYLSYTHSHNSFKFLFQKGCKVFSLISQAFETTWDNRLTTEFDGNDFLITGSYSIGVETALAQPTRISLIEKNNH